MIGRSPFGRLGWWLGVLVVSSVALVGRLGGAAAEDLATFRATASAEGVRVGLVANGAPVTNHVIDLAGPVAQAVVDSTTGSSALGSVAYPGDLVVTAPGLLAGLSGGQTSGVVPPYPLIAVAGSTGEPESTVDGPGSSMRAAGDARQAEASATTGAGAEVGAAATIGARARVEVDDDTVTATASSEASSVTIGPLVLGHVVARSTATAAPGEDVQRRSSFEVIGVSIAGVDLRITADGLVVAGTAQAVPMATATAILDGAGISMRWIDEEETADGVVSAGLVVTREQELPAAVTPVTTSFTFGRAAASVSSLPISFPEPTPPRPEGSVPAPTPVVAGAGGGSGASPPGTMGDAPSVQPAAHDSAGAAILFDLTTLYLVLVVGAASAGAVLELLRHQGVRLPWT